MCEVRSKHIAKINNSFVDLTDRHTNFLTDKDFGPMSPLERKKCKGIPKPLNKQQIYGGLPQEKKIKPQKNNGNGKTKKDTRKWCEFCKNPTPNKIECHAKELLVAKIKA